MWDAQKQADRRAFPGRFRWGRFLGLLSLWALLWGFWSAISVSQDLREHDRARGDERRARQDRVRSAAHELALALARAAAEVQVRATALWATARAGQPSAPAQFGPGILHWAEVYADEQGLLGVRRQFRGPRWDLSSTLEKAYLEAAVEQLSPRIADIRGGPGRAFRLADPGDPTRDWLIFAYGLPWPETNFMIALVDPAREFAESAQRAARDGKFRAWVASRDGMVIAHSVSGYVGTRFAERTIFRDGEVALAKASARLKGRLPSVIAPNATRPPEEAVLSEVKGEDGFPVAAAFARFEGLPLVAAVEEVWPTEPSGLLPPRQAILARGVFSFFLGWLLLAPVLAWLSWSRRKRRAPLGDPAAEIPARVVTPPPPPLAAMSVRLSETVVHQPVVAAESPARVYPATFEAALVETVFREQSVLTSPTEAIEEMPPTVSAVETLTVSQARARAAASEIMAQTLRTQAERADAERKARLEDDVREQALLEAFETELIRTQEPRRIASRLTELASRLFGGAPSAFFSYHEGLKAGLLLTSSGLSSQSRKLVSFAIDDQTMREILRADQEGRVATLENCLPLRDLMTHSFSARAFDAWALTGIARRPGPTGGARLLGVLVIFKDNAEFVRPGSALAAMEETDPPDTTAEIAPTRGDRQTALKRALRSTGPLYERQLYPSHAASSPPDASSS